MGATVCLMWASINSPLGGQVGLPFPRSSESLFTLVSKLVSATNGRSWNTGTEVSFGGVGSLDRQSVPHLKIAPNPFPFSYKEKRKRNSGGKERKSKQFRSTIGFAPKNCPKSLSSYHFPCLIKIKRKNKVHTCLLKFFFNVLLQIDLWSH